MTHTPGTEASGAPKAAEKLPEHWSELPTYLHFFTLGYFATNFFNIWAYNEMAPHRAVGLMALVGFVGGLAEHISPYFPQLTIPVSVEKVLFRIPTILATGIVFATLEPWPPWWLLFAGWAIYFWRAPGLYSLELSFHIRHFGVTHLGGTAGTLCLLAVWSGRSALLAQLLHGP